MSEPVLRMLADDLTGALDSAAAFASPAAPVAVRWSGPAVQGRGAVALDSGTREVGAAAAGAAVAALAPGLWAETSGTVAFKKLDSLLRGNEVAELCACLDILLPTTCIIAPAFPAQRRITRGGRQMQWVDGLWCTVATDLVSSLRRAGFALAELRPGARLPAGIAVFDAESDADLDAIVAAAAGQEDVLWVGSGGLAAALARAHGVHGSRAPAPAFPLLGLVGSEHPAAFAQLARLGQRHVALSGQRGEDRNIAARLAGEGCVFATVSLPAGTKRTNAARLIAARFAALVSALEPPKTLFVAGGETLRSLCAALGADHLDVTGEIMPGVPCSILRGGRWDGARSSPSPAPSVSRSFFSN
ncbi:hypothetical protein GCM10007301_08240 [Azorhizobium oxalatiphilum]|uniref:Hrp-dependent type III effector protein n=1 Tax=Azorhizobium oxalatiphilum TaxID=980631 RepID=A0A917F416_9HYPH|nr:four-carbon acid sugar kinase family protein [Azorhizobium oxalatiphilum]GGF51171.1 hypothetical protein GCM10007301_08240 [Azorhizobium oxalatiphilum]